VVSPLVPKFVRCFCLLDHLPRDKNTARISGREAIPQYDDTIFTHFHQGGYWTRGLNNLTKCLLDRPFSYQMAKDLPTIIVKDISHIFKGWAVTDLDTLFRAQLDEVPYVRCESYVRGCDILPRGLNNLTKCLLDRPFSYQMAKDLPTIIVKDIS
jgi:hypothetical protein